MSTRLAKCGLRIVKKYGPVILETVLEAAVSIVIAGLARAAKQYRKRPVASHRKVN